MAVPDLVGEVADTTLATDLDEKKQLYADLEITEYWVTNVRDRELLVFRLQDDAKYQQCEYSVALAGLAIFMIEETLQQLDCLAFSAGASHICRCICRGEAFGRQIKS